MHLVGGASSCKSRVRQWTARRRRRFGLSLLGRFELTGPDGVVDLPSKKLAGLLAYLACTAPRPQSREKLSALLWGSHFDAQAKQNLRQALSRLRKVLGQDALESDGEVVSLNAAVVLCDVSRFEALVREGSRDALSAAADLYRGRLIDDVTVSEEGWNEWLTGERERLLELALGAMVGLGEQELAAGRAEHALKAGQRAIALNNLREDAHRLIVQALAATGRKAEALKHYQDLVALLKRELNTEPDAATRSLVAELRSTQLAERIASLTRRSPSPRCRNPTCHRLRCCPLPSCASSRRRTPGSSARRCGTVCGGGSPGQPRAATADDPGLQHGRLDAPLGTSRPRGHARSDRRLPQGGRRCGGAVRRICRPVPGRWRATSISATPQLMSMTPSRPCAPALPSSTRSAR